MTTSVDVESGRVLGVVDARDAAGVGAWLVDSTGGRGQVAEQWRAGALPAEIARALGADALRRLEDAEGELEARAGVAGERVHHLERQRCTGAEMAREGSVPSGIAREKQRERGDQLATAEAEVARLALRGRDHRQLVRRVALLVQSCGQMHAGSDDVGRRELDLAWFTRLEIDEDGRTGQPIITAVERTPIIEAVQEHDPQLVGRPRPAPEDDEGPQLSLRTLPLSFVVERELSGRGDRI